MSMSRHHLDEANTVDYKITRVGTALDWWFASRSRMVPLAECG